MNDKDKEGIKEVMVALAPHIEDIITNALSKTDQLREFAYELKHNGKEYLQNMPDPRCLERMLWGTVYGHVIQAALLSPNTFGTPVQLSNEAAIYSDIAVEAYQKRFSNGE